MGCLRAKKGEVRVDLNHAVECLDNGAWKSRADAPKQGAGFFGIPEPDQSGQDVAEVASKRRGRPRTSRRAKADS